MNKLLTIAAASIALASCQCPQQKNERNGIPSSERPKLMVGIVCDQMRWDHLVRFDERYGDGGFRRLMRDGYNCNQVLLQYIPTVTAVGHAALYTASVPALNGICGNSFLRDGEIRYCIDDEAEHTIGSDSKKGQVSPRTLLTTTVTDELRMATNFRSKVISISVKDRASVLPGGHTANAAYFMDSNSMSFVTSSYYMDSLPQWVVDFNEAEKAKIEDWQNNVCVDDGWRFIADEKTYVQSHEKNERYEVTPVGSLQVHPIANTVLADLAMAAVDNEQLGADNICDFLAISFSSTDYLGHRVADHSSYLEDMYLRLDKDLEALFNHLDQKVGKGQWSVFLTADHAVAHNVTFRKDHNIPAEGWMWQKADSIIKSALGNNAKYYRCMQNMQVYLDVEKIRTDKANQQAIEQTIIDALLGMKEVAYCFPIASIPDFLPEPIRHMVINGYNPKRGGQLQIIYENGVTENYDYHNGNFRGTNHTVWCPYDAHVPCIFMGKNIPAGETDELRNFADIAATTAAYLNIQQPSGCVGEVIPFE